MAYDRDDIERIRQSINIVELAEAVTTVKKAGRSHKAICPFHQEKTPSMSLDPSRGLFHCFGCQRGGDVFKFVMESQALDFTEAVEMLAKQAGVTLRVDPQAAKNRGKRQKLTEAVALATEFYHQRLKSAPDAADARSYLRGRGYHGEVVDQFMLGYAPEEPGWDLLVQHLKEKGVTEATMLDAGLATKTQRGRLRDWFHNRLLFPIFDLKGDAVGFGGRLLDGEGPKYVNTQETRIYQKARLLYGLNLAKSRIAREGTAVVVEGYTDVIAMHLAGMDVAVATCGTALGEDHFDLLRRFSDKVVLAFDADKAGAGAALRGGELQTPTDLGLDLRVVQMPEGKDPADLVSAGEMDVLTKAIEDSVPIVAFQIEKTLERHDLTEVEGKTRALREAAPLIAHLEDAVARGEYARRLARQTGIEDDMVRLAIRQARSGGASGAQKGRSPLTSDAPGPATVAEHRNPLEDEALRLYASGGFGSRELISAHFGSDGYRTAFRALEAAPRLSNGLIDLGALDPIDEALASRIRGLSLQERPEDDAEALFRRLEVRRLEAEIEVIRQEVERVDPDDQAYSTLAGRLVALLRERSEWRSN